MPLGFQRLNERTQRPNQNINFIKPVPNRPDTPIAQDFLERIAAQCYPVMKEHYISVMALEEYDPNPEFLGRNFNAGEVIQLVLKDRSGRWLSFKFVQMVMMHELAHCKQMNHSRFFWGVRNGYAKQMEELWAKGYVGEGMWGRGKDLASGQFTHDHMPENAQIPQHLCGGTYRRRGRKRKPGQQGEENIKLTYAERQQKQVGKHGEGETLGEDELVRGALDSKSGRGKPRVANSKRGRELRANAALARFDAMKAKPQSTPKDTPELETDAGSETESDGWSSDEDNDSSQLVILRKKAGQIQDQHGHNMVRVCDDEGEEDEGAKDEMDELRILSERPKDFPEKAGSLSAVSARSNQTSPRPNVDDSETETESDEGDGDLEALPHKSKASANKKPPPSPRISSEASAGSKLRGQAADDVRPNLSHMVPQDLGAAKTDYTTPDTSLSETNVQNAQPSAPPTTAAGMMACPICSLENEVGNPTCIACSHVLKTSLVNNSWRCKSEACKGGKYINAGDVNRCGICGAQKSAAVANDRDGNRAMGITSASTLRWD
ncbi:DNA-dependent metalloprotease WSS1 [Teratosphaeria destructans]|uniref:DNA-dependent metalloprotease WSS1 n=1 Tax=Teratosphaeria destructans TaxID=418781 RepID=A0A9W7SV81_9PEZI|nr:DNA-dependent metalloprotease WSS1 [Teratosphaeria destructans]